LKPTNFDMIAAVIQFNAEILRIDNRPVGLLPANELDHITKCLVEEVDELRLADTPTDQVDALLDTIYFAIGGLYKAGLTRSMIIDTMHAVHRANMRKALGKLAKRDTGAPDAVKPLDWIGPEVEIASILGTKSLSFHK